MCELYDSILNDAKILEEKLDVMLLQDCAGTIRFFLAFNNECVKLGRPEIISLIDVGMWAIPVDYDDEFVDQLGVMYARIAVKLYNGLVPKFGVTFASNALKTLGVKLDPIK